jgi:F-type H+-transporting ATPase subunit b
VFAIARHALTDLASASLEKQMCNVFTGRIRSMDEASKTRLSEALSEEAEAARIRSAFEIEPEQRTLIQDTINKTFDREVPLQFETKPDLISGIELSTNGQKVAWSLADYLKSLEKGIGELLKEKPKVKATPKAEGEPEFIADTENK